MARESTRVNAAAEAAVSNAVSRLYLETFGKGPVRVETRIYDQLVVTLLHDVFTVAEKSLLGDDREDNVINTRMLWQHAVREQFKEVVGRATTRDVAVAISGFDAETGMATEVFVLAPAPSVDTAAREDDPA